MASTRRSTPQAAAPHGRRACLLLLALLPQGLAATPATNPPAAAPPANAAVFLPSPPELFLALTREEKVRWRQFYRAPALPTSADRNRGAFALGGILADLYIAVEARDAQRVRDVGQDLATSLGSLGLKGRLDHRMRRLGSFAEAQDWAAIRYELDASGNELNSLLAAQLDPDLSTLVQLGLWVRALEVTLRSSAARYAAAQEGNEAGPAPADPPPLPEVITSGVPTVLKALRQLAATLSPPLKKHPLVHALETELARSENHGWDPRDQENAPRLAAIIALINSEP